MIKAKSFYVSGGGFDRVRGVLALAVVICAVATAVGATQIQSRVGAGGGGALNAASLLSVKDTPPAPPAAGTAAATKTTFKTVDALAVLPWREIEVDAASPSKRSGHSVTAIGRKLFVFGGCYREEVCYNDMRVYNTAKDEWKEISGVSRDNSESMSMVPSSRGRHSATPFKTADGPKIIIFGGSANELYRNDVFLFDAKKKAWTKPIITGTPPTPRAGHAAALWHGRLFVTGGYTPDGYVNDLMVLDTTIMAWTAPPATGTWPSPRAGHSFTHIAITQSLPDSARAHGPPALPTATVGIDAAAKPKSKAKHAAKPDPKLKVRMSERLVLFGGANDRNVLNDLYIFDAALMTWSRPAISGLPPAPRHDHVAATHNEYVFINGGCDIRKLECYNDTVALDTSSMTWRNPMHPIKLKVPVVEPVSDPTGILSAIKKRANKAIRKQKQAQRKKKRGWFSKLKGAVGVKFSQVFSEEESENGDFERDADEAEEEEADRDTDTDTDTETEAITAASTTNNAAPRFVEQRINEETAAPRFAQVHATAAAGNDQHKTATGAKRVKKQRHTDQSKPSNAKFEDPIKALTPRGGHSGAFIKNHFYIFGGCFLEQTCNFDFLYQHVPTKRLRAMKRNAPDVNGSPVLNQATPNPAPAPTSGIGAILEKAKRDAIAKENAKKAPKKLTIDSAHVGTSFVETAADAEDASEETETAMLESAAHAKSNAKAKSKASGNEEEADELESESESSVRAQMMAEKRERVLKAVRLYHSEHVTKGERDLTAEDRDARDEAETRETIRNDMANGFGLDSEGELAIGAQYETQSKMKAVVNSKLFIPLAVIVGLVLIGCIVLIVVWQYCKSTDSEADQAVDEGGIMGTSTGKPNANPSLAASIKAKLATPADIERTLLLDSGARAALAKDLAAQEAAAAPVSARKSTASSASSAAASEEDRKALDSGQMV